MRPLYYLLDGRNVVPTTDRAAADRAIGTRIARTDLPDGVAVSTVFLAIDQGYRSDGPPVVFETMVFGGPLDMAQQRYSTYAEAEAGHAAMVERVLRRGEISLDD